MRVLHVLGTGRAGGVETFVLQLARALPRSEAEISVCILGASGPIVEELRDAGVPVSIRDAGISGSGTAMLARMLATQSFDIVHTNSGGRLVRLLSGATAYVIAHLHGLEASWLGDVSARGQGLSRRVRSLETGAHELAVSSQWMKQLLIDGGAKKPIVALRYGVDVERFSPAERARLRQASRATFGIAADATVIGFVGRLAEQKGPRRLLELVSAFAGDPRTRFLICGDGPARAQLQLDANGSSGSKAVFTGDRLDVPAVMSAFDVTVMTSEWEPFGIVALESAAMGIPVVAFRTGGITEAVEDGVTGVLVPQLDVSALADAVRSLLSDTARAQSFGENGRARALAHFDSRSSSAAVLDHYRAIMKSSLA